MLPEAQVDGSLPPGVHEATWSEFCARFGRNDHRRRLLIGLKAVLENLRSAGCRFVFIDGSFVTSRELPKDFDGCWEVSGVDLTRLDPVLLTFDPGRAKQKAKYGGEMFPSVFNANSQGDTFLQFFQMDRDGRAKGIVVLDLRREP